MGQWHCGLSRKQTDPINPTTSCQYSFAPWLWGLPVHCFHRTSSHSDNPASKLLPESSPTCGASRVLSLVVFETRNENIHHVAALRNKSQADGLVGMPHVQGSVLAGGSPPATALLYPVVWSFRPKCLYYLIFSPLSHLKPSPTYECA